MSNEEIFDKVVWLNGEIDLLTHELALISETLREIKTSIEEKVEE